MEVVVEHASIPSVLAAGGKRGNLESVLSPAIKGLAWILQLGRLQLARQLIV